jgi:protein O-mannosyl-transferase
VVFVAACLPFMPAMNAGFSDFDDQGFLFESTAWRGIAPDNFAWMFSTMHLGHYQPLTYLSYAIDHAAFGMDPRAFHATNIFLHGLSAVLFSFLIARLLTIAAPGVGQRAALFTASAAAVLWAVHPLRVESVAWITERRDVLSAVFLIAATLAYLRSASPREAALRSRAWYWASLGLLMLSLFAKAWGITFIAIAILLDIYPLRRMPLSLRALRDAGARRVLIQKLPFAAACVMFAIIAAQAQLTASAETMRTLAEWGILERLAQATYGLEFYVRKSILPTNLSALYELPDAVVWYHRRWVAPVLLVIAATLVAISHRRRAPGLGPALAAYAILLAPVLGLAQSGIQLVADRYSYLAVIPLFALAAAGAAILLTRATSNLRIVIPAAAAILAIALAILTWQRSELWGDNLRLWESAIQGGHEGPTLRNYYARQLEKAGRPADAIAQYHASLALRPSFADNYFGVGTASKAMGDFAAAEAAFKKAAELDPDPTTAYVALGLLYIMHLDRPADAIAAFQRGVEACERAGNPAKTGRPHLMLAAAYGESGDDAQAIRWLREAAKWPDSRAEALEHLRELDAPP